MQSLIRLVMLKRLLVVLSSLALFAATSQSQSIGGFSVSVRTDALLPVSNPVVILGQGNVFYSGTGNADGHTQGIDLDLAEVVTVRIEEALALVWGCLPALTVGQQLVIKPHEEIPSAQGFRHTNCGQGN